MNRNRPITTFKKSPINMNKVGHLYCRICVGIEVSNLLRILLSKFISKGSESTVGFVSNMDRIRVPTVDDQPYLRLKYDKLVQKSAKKTHCGAFG